MLAFQLATCYPRFLYRIGPGGYKFFIDNRPGDMLLAAVSVLCGDFTVYVKSLSKPRFHSLLPA